MNCGPCVRWGIFGLAALMAAMPSSAQACAACFGKSDSRLAEGMNMGIFSLLAVVVCVLGGIASFFVYLAKRSASGAASPLPAGVVETTQ